jgi:hypothetical protein
VREYQTLDLTLACITGHSQGRGMAADPTRETDRAIPAGDISEQQIDPAAQSGKVQNSGAHAARRSPTRIT